VVTAPDIPGHRVGGVLGAGGIDVYDAGTLGDGRPYLVMELCPAGSLSDALRRNGPMPPGQVRTQTASREALTPAYSSPETFRGEEPTALADPRGYVPPVPVQRTGPPADDGGPATSAASLPRSGTSRACPSSAGSGGTEHRHSRKVVPTALGM
jgi:hypothetical protein